MKNRKRNLAPRIVGIDYALPERIVTNEEVAKNSKWTADEIYIKLGIKERHVVSENETASDLAFLAARQTLDKFGVAADQIDLLIFCSQCPDYALPTSACLLQNRLGISTRCAAFDFNLGCSGYVYGLAIASSMMRTGCASKALLLTGETYSKYLSPDDFSVKSIFGDAGTATILEMAGLEAAGVEAAGLEAAGLEAEGLEAEGDASFVGPFTLCSDGSGGKRLVVGGSGGRKMENDPTLALAPEGEKNFLFMDGPEIFAFTTRVVPPMVKQFLRENDWTWDDFDWVVFHQANKFILDYLRNACRIPAEKFVYGVENVGNTVSNTIPIALAELGKVGRLRRGQRILAVGFGVGYSWGCCAIRW